MGQEQDSPAQEPIDQQIDAPPSDSIESAASAFSGLMDEGKLIQGDAEPQGQTEAPKSQEAERNDSPDPAKDTPAPLKLSLKIGDKDFAIPIPADTPEEVQQLVKDGLLMRADYSRKTMETAEMRKQVEARAQEMMGAYQTVNALPQHLAHIQSIDAQLQQFNNPELWQRLESDPLGKIEAKQAVQDLVNRRGMALAQLQQGQQQMTAYMQKQVNERLQAALPKVKEAIPDYGPEKVKALREFGLSIGLTKEQLDQTYDAAPLILLNMAMEGQKLKSDFAKQKEQVTQRVEKLPPKQVKSGVSQGAQDAPRMNQAAFDRLRQSGRTEDAGAALTSLLFRSK